MFFGDVNKDFTNDIENAFARFGMKNEQTIKGKSKNALRMRMYDTIHDSAYTAVAINKSAGKNVEKVWNDIIENDLIPEAIANKSDRGVNAGALIVPSRDIDAVAELLRKKGAAPTIYQLFDGYAVAGLNKQNMGLLVKSSETVDENKPEKPAQNDATAQPTPAENAPQAVTETQAPLADLAAELTNINAANEEIAKPAISKIPMTLKKKLAAAALLGIAVGMVPFAAKMVTDNLSTPDNAIEISAAAQEAERYFSDVKNGAPEDIEMLKAIASNPEAANEYLELLADTPVGLDVIKNPSAPEKAVAAAAKSNNEEQRAAAAENPNTPIDMLERMMNDKSPKVRAALAKNPSITKDMMSKLATDKIPEVRESLLENMSLPPDILDEVTKDAPRNCETLRKMMANPCISPEMLDYNKDNPNECIRMGVAANPQTPPEAVAKLTADNNRAVRDAALKNPQIPEETLRNLFADWNPKTETTELKADRNAAIGNKSLNPDVIQNALRIDHSGYSKSAASNPRTPPEAIAKILERASGKQGLKNFIDNALDIKTDDKTMIALKNEATANGTGVAVPLRKMLNNSFAKDVFDPQALAKDMRDAKRATPNIVEYKLTKPKTQRNVLGTNTDKSGTTYSLADMPEMPDRFADIPLPEENGSLNESAAAEQAALETADTIIDSLMADVLPAVEAGVMPINSTAPTTTEGLKPDTAGVANASRAGGTSGYGAAGASSGYGGGSLPNDRAELLFKNACERIDDLNKIF